MQILVKFTFYLPISNLVQWYLVPACSKISGITSGKHRLINHSHTSRRGSIKEQGQKFVAVFKAKNRGAATSQSAKNRGIVAAEIVKIAAVSRQKS